MVRIISTVVMRYWSLGLRAGSFDKNPKINNDTKNVITVYTKIFKVTIKV